MLTHHLAMSRTYCARRFMKPAGNHSRSWQYHKSDCQRSGNKFGAQSHELELNITLDVSDQDVTGITLVRKQSHDPILLLG
jgi:hypothetical protein